jgi:hypothetical protein
MVPVGVVAIELEVEVTLIVMVSLAPEEGDVVEAVSDVREDCNEEADVVGHDVNSL